MSNPELVDEQPISMVELKDELKKIQKRDKELGFRANKMEDYLNVFVHLNTKEAKELEDEITKLNIPRLKDKHIKKVVDIMPSSVEQLKIVLQGYALTVNQDNQKKIVAAVKKFLPEKK